MKQLIKKKWSEMSINIVLETAKNIRKHVWETCTDLYCSPPTSDFIESLVPLDWGTQYVWFILCGRRVKWCTKCFFVFFLRRECKQRLNQKESYRSHYCASSARLRSLKLVISSYAFASVTMLHHCFTRCIPHTLWLIWQPPWAELQHSTPVPKPRSVLLAISTR